MSEDRPSPQSEESAQGSEQEWLRLAQLAAETGSDVAQLMALELRLAMANLGRMVVLAVAFLPLLILLWLGFSVLASWVLYQSSDSVTWAIVLFLTIQGLALWGVYSSWMRYRRTLSLPQTRKHLQYLVGAQSDESKVSNS
ncbi:hypothetical protein H2508_09870 [Parahaliea sp. F7430]|uniref:Superfamily III holin-X n=1 Tax=Sediminihaliea albiluteola TaxID=2758564 RepID=A0A7W2TX30_9GAMM|nr:hypothetical protein [Sediminihaliea albiluteola]MBA6413414.1 hypothetical protein [Sediminihaliea albiluteola]